MIAPPAALVARFGSLTAADVTALDAAAAVSGVEVAQLMETAGWQVARCVHAAVQEWNGRRIVVVAGSGNNGGDALVAARHLLAWGLSVETYVVAHPERWRLARLTEPLRRLGIQVTIDTAAAALLERLGSTSDTVVVDGLLGTGMTAAPRPTHSQIILAMGTASVVSVDIPSGLDATSGKPFVPTVRARRTCTLAAMKAGLWTPAAREYAGDIWVADIGIPQVAWRLIGQPAPTGVTVGELLPVSTHT